MRPETLGVIGLGAIGGSVAWQAARAGTARVLGYTPQPKEGVMAVRCGAITELAPNIPYVLRNADLVVLAAPPGATLDLLKRVANEGKATPLVTDVTSVKQPVAATARAAGLEARFAGSHPLAGTHKRGFAAATADMFRGALVYVTPVGEDQRPVREVADFWAGVLEAEPVIVSPDEHDRVLAWTSHLPQAVASALAVALATGGPRGVTYGSGAKGTTRIAASSAEIWADVFMLNREPILSALNRFDEGLGELRRALANGDARELKGWLERGASWRRGCDQ
jgi:prephenate dehydrogenase